MSKTGIQRSAIEDGSVASQARTQPALKLVAPAADKELLLEDDRYRALAGIARRVLIETEAVGAAIALEIDGRVVCCARSGQSAPEIGAELNRDTGISGLCLRSGEPVRCSDVSSDSRVDHEAARNLGIASMLAVPVVLDGKTVGVVEVLSRSPYAFGVPREATVRDAGAQVQQLLTKLLAITDAAEDWQKLLEIVREPEGVTQEPVEPATREQQVETAPEPPSVVAGQDRVAMRSGEPITTELEQPVDTVPEAPVTWLRAEPIDAAPEQVAVTRPTESVSVPEELVATAAEQPFHTTLEEPVDATLQLPVNTAPEASGTTFSAEPIDTTPERQAVTAPEEPVTVPEEPVATMPEAPPDTAMHAPADAAPPPSQTGEGACATPPEGSCRTDETVAKVSEQAVYLPQARINVPEEPFVAAAEEPFRATLEGPIEAAPERPVVVQSEQPLTVEPEDLAAIVRRVISTDETLTSPSRSGRPILLFIAALGVIAAGVIVFSLRTRAVVPSAPEPPTLETRKTESGVQWLRDAAERGEPFAQYQLALRYRDRDGVERNDTESVRWLQEAARQGNADAQYELGNVYAAGQGVEQDPVHAYACYVLAWANGNPASEQALRSLTPTLSDAQITHVRSTVAEMYLDGRGAPVDYVAAYTWFRLAGDPDSQRARQALASKMTAAQVAAAERRAGEWLQRHGQQPR